MKESIEALVIGNFGDEDINFQGKGKILKWDEKTKEILNREFCDDYGTPEGYAVYIWSKNYIMVIEEYDGKTFPVILPRNPINVIPKFI